MWRPDLMPLLILVPLVPLLAGVGVLWARSRLCPADDPTTTSLSMVLAIIGWFGIVVGVIAEVLVTTQVLGFLMLVVTAAVALILGRRYFDAERQSLLWVLMAAADRGIPLEVAARAFAQERSDVIGIRARNLADYLEAGVPLALALGRSGHTLPTAALLAADLGSRTGMLGPALRQAIGEVDEIYSSSRTIWEKLAYFCGLVLYAVGIVTFIMLKIMPVFAKMFEEFDLALPGITVALISVSEIFVRTWFLAFPFFLLLLGCGLVGLLCYLRLLPRNLPILRRLWSRADTALILRWLAIGIRQRRPIPDMLRLLAESFPVQPLRRRLANATLQIEAGADWCDSLRRAGIIRRPEGVLFQAAERTGNLAWALDEMAESSQRRLAYRIRAWFSLLFPVVMLALGACMFFLAAAILVPLFAMIQGLS